MSSAAQRVFAITEILTQILLDCDLNTRQLFRWQNVSRDFHHAINGSTPLLREMEILHRLPEEKKYRVPNPILWTEQLELWGAWYRTEVLSPASPRNRTERWMVNVHVHVDVGEGKGDPAGGGGGEAQVGVKSSKFFINPLDGSWRRMKITRFPVLIEVPLLVKCGDLTYEEVTTDVSEEMCLGELADLVEEARRRSEGEHRERAARFAFERMELDDDVGVGGEEAAGCCVS